MTRSKSDAGSPAGIPLGQTASGPSRAPLGNPKTSDGDGATRFPDHLGQMPGGPDILVQGSNYGTSSYFEGGDAPNNANKGTDASEPDPAKVNRGYSQVVPSDLPATTLTSANRQRYNIDPGAQVLDGNGTPNVDSPGQYFHGATGTPAD